MRPRGYWIAPDEEGFPCREPAVRHSPPGVGRPQGDVPEGFCEKEESMRPRASLSVPQNWPPAGKWPMHRTRAANVQHRGTMGPRTVSSSPARTVTDVARSVTMCRRRPNGHDPRSDMRFVSSQ